MRDLVSQLQSRQGDGPLEISVDGLRIEIRVVAQTENQCSGERCTVPACRAKASGRVIRDFVQDEYNLTDRETEVVLLVHRGLSNGEIARTMGVSVGTVKRHVYNVFNKVGVDSRSHLLYCLQHHDGRSTTAP